MTMPKPSSSEGRANTLASWYRRTSSPRDGEATYSTLSRTPSEFALAKKIRGAEEPASTYRTWLRTSFGKSA
jgi:hypothetical protein